VSHLKKKNYQPRQNAMHHTMFNIYSFSRESTLSCNGSQELQIIIGKPIMMIMLPLFPGAPGNPALPGGPTFLNYKHREKFNFIHFNLPRSPSFPAAPTGPTAPGNPWKPAGPVKPTGPLSPIKTINLLC
jgi:hypothetical protein